MNKRGLSMNFVKLKFSKNLRIPWKIAFLLFDSIFIKTLRMTKVKSINNH